MKQIAKDNKELNNYNEDLENDNHIKSIKFKNNLELNILFKFPDNTLYYGKIKYLDKYGKEIVNIEEKSEVDIENYSIVRDGYGIQISEFNDNTGDYKSKYSGYWKNNKKCGFGIMEFDKNEIYIGNFFNNDLEGQGKYIWKGKFIYEGTWKENRMEGDGEFLNIIDNNLLKGTFACNYFVNDDGLYINPFTPKEMIQVSEIYGKLNLNSLTNNNMFSIQSITKFYVNDIKLQLHLCFKDLNKVPFIIRSSK